MNSNTNTSPETRFALWNQRNAHKVSDILLEKILISSEIIILSLYIFPNIFTVPRYTLRNTKTCFEETSAKRYI